MVYMYHFDETRLLTHMQETTLQAGRAKVVAATTCISMILSFIATAANLYAFGFLDADYITLVSLMIALVIPLMVALPVSWFVVSMVFSMHKLEIETRKLATYDALTGLLNRRAFLEEANSVYRNMAQSEGQFSMLILDLDDFKQINDTYGHAIGDRVLEVFGGIVQDVIRPGECAARIGGEEFAFLLPNSTDEEACAFAEQLHQLIGKTVIAVEGFAIRFSASIGLVVCAPLVTIEKAMSLADRALYHAKANGRNQSVLYSLVTTTDLATHYAPATKPPSVVYSAHSGACLPQSVA